MPEILLRWGFVVMFSDLAVTAADIKEGTMISKILEITIPFCSICHGYRITMISDQRKRGHRT